jgi:hypothetical protein
VREKEAKMLSMLRMNGMGDLTAYYVSSFATYFVSYSVSTILFSAAGSILNLELFRRTDFWVLFILLVLWGLAQTSLSFFLSAFFNQSSVAFCKLF